MTEAFSETQDKRTHITKSVLIALIPLEISKVWGDVNQELWMKTQYICKIYFFNDQNMYLNDQAYVFLVNHNIMPF